MPRLTYIDNEPSELMTTLKETFTFFFQKWPSGLSFFDGVQGCSKALRLTDDQVVGTRPTPLSLMHETYDGDWITHVAKNDVLDEFLSIFNVSLLMECEAFETDLDWSRFEGKTICDYGSAVKTIHDTFI